MNVYCNLAVFTLLFAGFFGMMQDIRTAENLRKAARLAVRRLDEKGKRSAAEKREAIRMRTDRDGFTARIDRALVYSCMNRAVPGITAEKFIAVITLSVTLILIGIGSLKGPAAGCVCSVLFLFFVYGCIKCMGIINLRKTGEDLPRLLDLLGSFAATGAVYSNVFGQISIYMNEPLRTVFEECEAEGRMSGDISLALLTMADKIEHPQFKQLIRNMEITSRHSEDITGLVNDTRRSLRDYIREASDRKAMLRESAINMVILLIMSFAVLDISAHLSEVSVYSLVFKSLPGRITLGVMASVCMMYFAQAASLYK